MKKLTLIAVGSNGKPVNKAAKAVSYTDQNKYFSIVANAEYCQITTAKGCYNIPKHPSLNIYLGTLNGAKTQVSIKENTGVPTGWICWWPAR